MCVQLCGALTMAQCSFGSREERVVLRRRTPAAGTGTTTTTAGGLEDFFLCSPLWISTPPGTHRASYWTVGLLGWIVRVCWTREPGLIDLKRLWEPGFRTWGSCYYYYV